MEPRYGHDNFLLLVLFVALCVNSAHCLITWILSRHSLKLLEPLLPPSLRDTCFSGFTGALLTLKMLLYKERPETDYDFASFQMAVPHWFGFITESPLFFFFVPETFIPPYLAMAGYGNDNGFARVVRLV
ncbi:hypothetical protein V5799_029069 [Amblyomma americanum]|uniref:Uncharacterized protein n=1 Tax=Amblyomma americanum TaxID=6943 RepID=A0AAQ4ESH2_AMBAM